MLSASLPTILTLKNAPADFAVVRNVHEAREAYADPQYSVVLLPHTPSADEQRFVAGMQTIMGRIEVATALLHHESPALFANGRHRFRLRNEREQPIEASRITPQLPELPGREAYAERLREVSENFLRVVVEPGHRARAGRYAFDGLQLDVDVARARHVSNTHEDTSPVCTFTGSGTGTAMASRDAFSQQLKAGEPAARECLSSGDVIMTRRHGPVFKPSARISRVARYMFAAPAYMQVFLRAPQETAGQEGWLPPTTHEVPWPAPQGRITDILRLRALVQ